MDIQLTVNGLETAAREFGWDGAAGAWMMVDPDHGLSAFYAQHVLNCGRAFDEFHPVIRDLIYEEMEL